jgi:hypothetical protein
MRRGTLIAALLCVALSACGSGSVPFTGGGANSSERLPGPRAADQSTPAGHAAGVNARAPESWAVAQLHAFYDAIHACDHSAACQAEYKHDVIEPFNEGVDKGMPFLAGVTLLDAAPVAAAGALEAGPVVVPPLVGGLHQLNTLFLGISVKGTHGCSGNRRALLEPDAR